MYKDKQQYNEYIRIYMAERYYKRRAFYLDKLGGKCVVCGSVIDLEFDHIDRHLKSFNVGKALAGWSEKKLDPEMEKCQLLCPEHHQDKSITERGNQRWQHGTLTGYRYCKCDLCRAAKAEYMKNYKRLSRRYSIEVMP